MDNIVVYNDGELELNVSLKKETVWLNRNQIAQLFDRDVKTIGKHIGNVFEDGELEKFSIGYKVNSKKAYEILGDKLRPQVYELGFLK